MQSSNGKTSSKELKSNSFHSNKVAPSSKKNPARVKKSPERKPEEKPEMTIANKRRVLSEDYGTEASVQPQPASKRTPWNGSPPKQILKVAPTRPARVKQRAQQEQSESGGEIQKESSDTVTNKPKKPSGESGKQSGKKKRDLLVKEEKSRRRAHRISSIESYEGSPTNSPPKSGGIFRPPEVEVARPQRKENVRRKNKLKSSETSLNPTKGASSPTEKISSPAKDTPSPAKADKKPATLASSPPAAEQKSVVKFTPRRNSKLTRKTDEEAFRPVKTVNLKNTVGTDHPRRVRGSHKEASVSANQYEDIVVASLEKWRTRFKKSSSQPMDPEELRNQADLRRMLHDAATNARHVSRPERELQETHFRSVSAGKSVEEIPAVAARIPASKSKPAQEVREDIEQIRHMLKVHSRRSSLPSAERRKTIEMDLGKHTMRDRLLSIGKSKLHEEDGGKDERPKGEALHVHSVTETPKCLEILERVTEFSMYLRQEPLEFRTPKNLYCAYNVLDNRGHGLFYIVECHDRCFACAAVSHFLPIYNLDGELILFVLKRNEHACQLRKAYHLATKSAEAYIQADEYLQSTFNISDSRKSRSAYHVRLFDGSFLGHYIEMPVDEVKNPYKFKIFDAAFKEVYQIQETRGSRFLLQTPSNISKVALSKNPQSYLQIYHDHHRIGQIVTGADLGRFGINSSVPITSYLASFPMDLPPIDKALILALAAVSHCESVVEDKQCCAACCYLCFCRCGSENSCTIS